MEFLTILTCSVVKFRFDSKSLSNKLSFLFFHKFFLIKNTFKVTLLDIFYILITLNTVSYIKLNLN